MNSEHTEHQETIVFDAMEEKREILRKEIAHLGSIALRVETSTHRLLETKNHLIAERDETLRDIEKVKDILTRKINQAAESAKEAVMDLTADSIKTKNSVLDEMNVQIAELKSHRELIETLMTTASDVEILENFSSVKSRSLSLTSRKIPNQRSCVPTLEHKNCGTLEDDVDKQFRLTQTKMIKVTVTSEHSIEIPALGDSVTGISFGDDTSTLYLCKGGQLFQRDAHSWANLNEVSDIDNVEFDVCVGLTGVAISKKVELDQLQIVLADVSLKRQNSIELLFKSSSPCVVIGPLVSDQATYFVIEKHQDVLADSVVHQLDCVGKIQQTYGKGVLRNPVGVSLGENGGIVVADCGINDVIMFHPDGSDNRRLRQHNNLNQVQLSRPHGICVDHDGFIFVSSCNTHSVLLFSPTGDFIQTLLTEKDGLKWPTKLSVSSDGHLAVVSDEKKVLIFKYQVLF